MRDSKHHRDHLMSLGFLGLLLIGVPSARAQALDTTTVLRPGARVRLRIGTQSPQWLLGTIARLTADTLWMRWGGPSEPIAIGWSAISELQVSRGRRSHARRGALVGAIVGGALGIGIGASWIGEPCTNPLTTPLGCTSPGVLMPVAILSAAAGGALWGVLVGAVVGTESWDHIPTDQGHGSFGPRDARIGVGATIRF